MFGVISKAAHVTLPALLLRCVTSSSAFTFTREICSESEARCPRMQTFLLLPLGFFARSRPAASVGSSAAAPASGSPAGRNPSRVRGPQLVPEHRDERGKERKRQMKNKHGWMQKTGYGCALLIKASVIHLLKNWFLFRDLLLSKTTKSSAN